jgi:hypothetical protein
VVAKGTPRKMGDNKQGYDKKEGEEFIKTVTRETINKGFVLPLKFERQSESFLVIV